MLRTRRSASLRAFTTPAPAAPPVTSRANEWERICALPANLLIVGDASRRHRLLLAALGRVPPQVHFREAGGSLALGAVASGVLVIDRVERLTGNEQRELMAWLERTEERVRVIAMSSEPLWQAVERGGFSLDLYYRLCVTQAGA